MITLHTNHGDIAIELDFDKAPISATNFLQYCRDEFYAGTILIGAVGVTKILYLFSRFYLCKKKEEKSVFGSIGERMDYLPHALVQA